MWYCSWYYEVDEFEKHILFSKYILQNTVDTFSSPRAMQRSVFKL